MQFVRTSFSRISSRTRPASACPRISFITAPMSAPAAACLPSRIFSATSGFAAIAVVDRCPEGAVVGDHGQAAARDDLVRAALACEHALDHLAGQLVVHRLVVDERLDPRDVGRRDGEVDQVDAVLVAAPGQLAEPPLARGLRRRARGDRLLDQAERAGADGVAHVEVAEAPLLLQPGAAHGRVLRQGAAQLLDPLAARRDRHQVRLGEVAVVLGVGLLATARGDPGVLVPVTGLLEDRAAVAQDHRVPLHLVAHGPLDRPERVDVLGLGARAQGAAALGRQREVHVGAQVALVHPCLRDAERDDQLAELGHVRLGDLGCLLPRAHDRAGDDLDERDPGAVVVDERVVRTVDATGGAADVQRLAGVLLHVGALDLDAEGLAVHVATSM